MNFQPLIKTFAKYCCLALCLALALLLLCACKGENEALPTASPTPTAREVVEISAPTPTPTPSPTPTPVPTPSPTPTPSGLCGGRFPDVFTDEVVKTETSYQSSELAIFITKVFDETSYSNFVTYFVADIYLQDIELLRTACAAGDFSKNTNASVQRMAEENNSLFACSGDYYGYYNRGLIIRNGIYYKRNLTDKREACVIFRDGTMETYEYEELDPEALMEQGAWQGWTFGPSLIDENGMAKSGFDSPIATANPRCVIGYYEPGHYCIIIVDGRQKSIGYSGGLTLDELAQLAVSLGCTKAFNLDGGESTQLYWNEGIYNSPYDGGRSLSDIIYFPVEP
ncbi:MAG: phosphodiester glycosidase family protein [Clostridia bacterium]|nr:phosphodiester glycosidase family protein [Clostridia bacterium]